MSETTEALRKAARAAVKDAKKLADKHLPVLRDKTKAVIDTELPKVQKETVKAAQSIKRELPKVAEALKKEIRARKK